VQGRGLFWGAVPYAAGSPPIVLVGCRGCRCVSGLLQRAGVVVAGASSPVVVVVGGVGAAAAATGVGK